MKKPTFLATAALLLLPALAWSQPDTNNGAKVENPPNRAPGGRGNGRGGQNMTPEERQQLVSRFIEERTKQTLTAEGFTDAALQDAVVAYLKEQQAAAAELQTKMAAITQALGAKVVTDPQLAALLNDYRALSDEDKVRHEKSLAALDTKISFSTKPRLDALILVADSTIGQFSSMMGGRGGMGGMMGGGRNGGVTLRRGGGFGALNP